MAAEITGRPWQLCGRDVLVTALVALIGCSSPTIKTHPVSGRIELKDGDVAVLKGSTIEFVQEADETIRCSGLAAADGTFQLKTFHDGEFVPGAREGTYKARIILADESDEGTPKRNRNPIHPRYFSFATSGLKVAVPSADYTLTLSSR